MRIIDTHSHIQFPQYDADRSDVMRRAEDAGVSMICVGTDLETSKSAIAVCEEYSGVVLGATVGQHPTDTDGGFLENEFREIARHKRVVAVGECGLDYYRVEDQQSRIRQAEIFIRHLALASEIKKPLVIHCRNAFPDLIQILTSNSSKLKTGQAGVIHFFSGTRDDAARLIDLGFYLGFGGVVTFTEEYHETIRNIPLERILSETDAPFVAPVPHRGQRNESAFIVHTVKALAAIREESVEEFSEALFSNAKKLFSV